MLCAGVKNTSLSGCHGDSGGPYVCLNSDNTTYTLHGAVSWGSASCQASQLYTVFARVTEFLPWIKSHTGLGPGGGLSTLFNCNDSLAASCEKGPDDIFCPFLVLSFFAHFILQIT